jgi:hypothetical protein
MSVYYDRVAWYALFYYGADGLWHWTWDAWGPLGIPIAAPYAWSESWAATAPSVGDTISFEVEPLVGGTHQLTAYRNGVQFHQTIDPTVRPAGAYGGDCGLREGHPDSWVRAFTAEDLDTATSYTTTFDSFALGALDGQDGWQDEPESGSSGWTIEVFSGSDLALRSPVPGIASNAVSPFTSTGHTKITILYGGGSAGHEAILLTCLGKVLYEFDEWLIGMVG